jgi:hypothetical protein
MRRRRVVLVAIAAVIGLVVPTAYASADPPAAPAGFFVVGDLSATVGAHVEFWGAQWWKDNSLSGGSAPAAFKGFADTVNDPTCPTSWSTDPGNSAPPPPTGGSDITVIVTSNVTKSGPIISGDVTELVTVHVDPGYAPDPGHAGTGIVTGIVNCGPTTTILG